MKDGHLKYIQKRGLGFIESLISAWEAQSNSQSSTIKILNTGILRLCSTASKKVKNKIKSVKVHHRHHRCHHRHHHNHVS
jgi:hypothetical protein